MSIGTLRLYCRRGAKTLQSFGKAVGGAERTALVDVKLDEPRCHGKRSVVAGNRGTGTAKRHMKAAAFVQRADIVALRCQDRLESHERFFIACERFERGGAVLQGIEIAGAVVKRLVEASQCFLVAAQRGKDEPVCSAPPRIAARA